MRIDLHVHMKRYYQLADIRRILRQRRLDGIAVTNFWDINFAKWLRQRLPEFLILVGKEVVTRGSGHILAVGIEEEVPDFRSPAETIALIHEQQALAILPHPFLFSNSITPLGDNAHLPFDAIEIFNYRAGPFLWPNSLAWLLLRHRHVPLVANTDSKSLATIGNCYNEVNGRSRDELFSQIRQGNVRRHTRMEWPSPAWFRRTLPYLAMRQGFGACGVCGGEIRVSMRKNSYNCVACGKRRITRIQCRQQPHYICKRCRTRRDFTPEALHAYRLAHGLDME